MSHKFPLKTGVVGVGHMGKYHVNVLAGLKSDQHELKGIYDINKDIAGAISRQYNVRNYDSLAELFEDCDAVTIAVPTGNHFEVAKQAIQCGCHVLVEKPITSKVEEAIELMELAQKEKIILQIGHVERFNGAVIELQKIVENPIYIETKRMAPFTPRIQDAGVVLDMLIHDLDIVLNLVKSPLKEYHALGQSIKGQNEDIALVTLKFENNAIASLMASRVSQAKERNLYITQENSYIILNYTNQDIEIHRKASSANQTTPEEIRYSSESYVENLFVHKDNPLKSEHIHFHKCIFGESDPVVSREKDIQTLKIALASVEMIKNGKTKGTF
ncbi:MAG: Gfo/Idh/MocA family oxidoreductase [Spirochaetia bacterium]|nr:Gfo/Idh/MocA family oxidoreductase [Spirochaetia bacterium]